MTPSKEQLALLADRAAKSIKAAGADSVVVIVTYDTDGGDSTGHYKTGCGNYYAQRGSAIEWIDRTREAPTRSEPPDEADAWKNA